MHSQLLPIHRRVLSRSLGTTLTAQSPLLLQSTTRKGFRHTGSACKLSTPTRKSPVLKSAPTEEALGSQPPDKSTTSSKTRAVLGQLLLMSRSLALMETLLPSRMLMLLPENQRMLPATSDLLRVLSRASRQLLSSLRQHLLQKLNQLPLKPQPQLHCQRPSSTRLPMQHLPLQITPQRLCHRPPL